jgi:hypothetical protein
VRQLLGSDVRRTGQEIGLLAGVGVLELRMRARDLN